jgi:hypothetical protein
MTRRPRRGPATLTRSSRGCFVHREQRTCPPGSHMQVAPSESHDSPALRSAHGDANCPVGGTTGASGPTISPEDRVRGAPG